MGRIPDVALPLRFSERMLWRQLFDRNPLFVTFCDKPACKLACKRWIAERDPALPLPRVLWQGDRAEDIPPDLLRPGVAIKATHGSGFNLLIRDHPPPREDVVATARRWLATAWGVRRGEWAYAPVPRRVFVEERIAPTPEDPPGARLPDIKIHAGGGRAGIAVSLTVDRQGRRGGLVFDTAGRRLSEPGMPLPEIAEAVPAPQVLQAAFAAARRLSVAVDYARFDFLAVGQRLYAGEITVFHLAGYREFGPVLGPLVEGVWDLRRSWFLREGAACGGWLARAYAAACARDLPAASAPGEGEEAPSSRDHSAA